MPVNISLVIKFNLSIKTCKDLNLGMAIAKSPPTTININATATTIIHAIEVFVPSTIIIPPTPNIGA